MNLLIATTNKNKVKEFKNMFKEYKDINIISLNDLNDHDEVVEDGTTFSENAYLKAKHFYDKYHYLTLSDDSGLVVPELNGEPGIYSSRYSGHGPEENIKLLLHKLEGSNDRRAYFECDICFIDEDGTNYFRGTVDGKIAHEKHGDDGFGYDPVFIYKDKTFAEMGLDEKNKISHRANALQQFISFFIKKYLHN